jgi:MFS family permease
MDGAGGYAGWRWIFILEGIITIAISVLVFLVVPGFPQESLFLTDEERARLLRRLQMDRGDEKNDIEKVKWLKVLTDYKIWLL